MTALGVKDVSVGVEVTVGRQDSGVQSWNSTKPGEISRYDEHIPVGVRAGVTVQIDNRLFSGSIGADLSAKVMTKTDTATGRDRGGFEVAGTVKGSHSQTGTLQSQNHATGEPGSQSPDPSGLQNSSTVTVGAVGEQVKITTLEALDPQAHDDLTGEVDVGRALVGGLAAGTKLAAHVVTQAPGALVQGALNTGQMMFDGTNFAAKAVIDGATYLASNAVHSVRNGFAGGHEAGVQAMQDGQARRQAYEAGNTDAGEMLGRASAQVGTFNSGVGAVVDAVVGAPVDLARLHYTGDAALGMDNQQLRQAGYGSLAATQEKVEAASAGLQADPMFQAPSLPTSPAEALQRIIPG